MNNTKEHLLDCLANYIVRLPTLERRREFIANFKHKNQRLGADIEKRVKAKWEQKRRGNDATKTTRR